MILHKYALSVNKNSSLYPIYEKIYSSKRINDEDALQLFESSDILTIGTIANIIRERYNKNKAYYILNGQINYSNVCSIRCSFCSFRRRIGEDGAYAMSLEKLLLKFREFDQDKITEIHIVGGLHPKLPLSYYTEIIKTVKIENPKITVKAFTAVEIAYFSSLYKISVEKILKKFIDSGLEIIPGGGAEIFSKNIRKKICPTKITGEKWLEIHNIAHKMGLKTNATMLFGHIESYKDRIDHMNCLRKLQDKTNGFLSFIPLTYHPDNNPLRRNRTSGLDELKTLAISRIYLDNFPHIKAYWIMLGTHLAQLALNFGADDLDGTVKEEKIYHEAGAKTPQTLSKKELNNLILEAKKEPTERDSFYRVIHH